MGHPLGWLPLSADSNILSTVAILLSVRFETKKNMHSVRGLILVVSVQLNENTFTR